MSHHSAVEIEVDFTKSSPLFAKNNVLESGYVFLDNMNIREGVGMVKMLSEIARDMVLRILWTLQSHEIDDFEGGWKKSNVELET
jgi:hypothetical protein